jgi:hypothetical protein
MQFSNTIADNTEAKFLKKWHSRPVFIHNNVKNILKGKLICSRTSIAQLPEFVFVFCESTTTVAEFVITDSLGGIRTTDGLDSADALLISRTSIGPLLLTK